MKEDQLKVIIDADPGVDDGAAIINFLNFTNVVAITTTFGNKNIAKTTNNACRILQYLEHTNVPVYAGAHCNVLGENSGSTESEDPVNGEDGLNGTLVVPSKVEKEPEQDEFAPTAIINLPDSTQVR